MGVFSCINCSKCWSFCKPGTISKIRRNSLHRGQRSVTYPYSFPWCNESFDVIGSNIKPLSYYTMKWKILCTHCIKYKFFCSATNSNMFPEKTFIGNLNWFYSITFFYISVTDNILETFKFYSVLNTKIAYLNPL